MPNANAESGKNYERRVIAALNATDPEFRAHRQPQPTWADRGDIRFSTVVLQCKAINTGTVTMTRYLEDAEEQAARHDDDNVIPAVIVRIGDDVDSDLVLLRATGFLALVAQRDALEAQLDLDTDY